MFYSLWYNAPKLLPSGGLERGGTDYVFGVKDDAPISSACFGKFFAHPQERKTVFYCLWYNAPTMLPANGRQHRGCIIPQAVTHSLAPLKMGKIIARNMLS